jgi:hypothetical protein
MREMKTEETNYDFPRTRKYGKDSSGQSYSNSEAPALGSQTFCVGLHRLNEFRFLKHTRESYL